MSEPAGELEGRLSAEQVRDEQAALLQPPGQTGQTEQTGQSGKSGEDEDESLLKEWVGLLTRAACWALLIYLFIFQVSVVDGTSMMPGFEHHDRLVIDKLTYLVSPVKRFDVIVFEAIDTDRSLYTPRDYIKRVIGLPGETIEIRNGKVRIMKDGEAQELNEKYQFMPFTSHRENSEPGIKFVVPPEHYFVMGDNRGDSKDSRRDTIGRTLGYVPRKQIKGLVRLRLDWPWKRLKWLSRGE